MWDWINNILAHWQFVFINGLIDYLGDMFVLPTAGRFIGPLGGYFSSGLTFTAKQAAQNTGYFQGLGAMMGSWGGQAPAQGAPGARL